MPIFDGRTPGPSHPAERATAVTPNDDTVLTNVRA
jgi:hypothetical protein